MVTEKRDFVIFTHGDYKIRDVAFYRTLCERRFTIAVNGGMNYFFASDQMPDLLMGDLDSVTQIHDKLPAEINLLTFPVHKNKTDLQLAFEFCLEKHARSVDIVLPSFGEPDHFLGNIMLVHLLDRYNFSEASPIVKFVNVWYEILFCWDERQTFTRCEGERVSVIPLSSQIVLNCKGTEYEVNELTIFPGDTRALRNRIIASEAVVEVKGKALVIHQHKQKG